MTSPRLSVVMSVYNGEEFLADAIACVLAQTYRDFEFIIVNDGSDDGSLGIMQEFAAKDPRIRILDQENTGLTIALRRGIEAARGEFIARMDVDDISMPERFEKQMALLISDPALVAVTSDIEHFNSDGSGSRIARFRQNPQLLPLLLVFSNAIGGHGQMIFRRDAYIAAGGYSPDVRFSQDYDLWIRLADQGEFGVVPEVLYRYRTGHENLSARFGRTQSVFSVRSRRRQYKKVTGSELDVKVAQGLWDLTMHGSTENSPLTVIWSIPSAQLRAIHAFFRDNPGLLAEKSELIRVQAARWWWRRKDLSGFKPVLLLVIVANVARLMLASWIAKAQHGTKT